MIPLEKKPEVSTAAHQLETAVEIVLDASSMLLEAGHKAQVRRLEEIALRLQTEVEEIVGDTAQVESNVITLRANEEAEAHWLWEARYPLIALLLAAAAFGVWMQYHGLTLLDVFGRG